MDTGIDVSGADAMAKVMVEIDKEMTEANMEENLTDDKARKTEEAKKAA